jgi:enoyl-CoA hydratase
MQSPTESPLQIEVADDGVATVTLNRPDKRNALSIALRDTLAGWIDDEAVRVVVLTGAPPAFSAGFDLAEFGEACSKRRAASLARSPRPHSGPSRPPSATS